MGEKAGQGEAPTRAPEGEAEDVPEWVTQRGRSWARLLRRIYEVDPLVRPRCGEEMKVVSVITDPVVVDWPDDLKVEFLDACNAIRDQRLDTAVADSRAGKRTKWRPY